MKKHIFTVAILMALLLSIMAPGITGASVSAQEPECRDAAGGVIPCPPTEDTSGGDGGNDSDDGNQGGGNQNPPSVPPTVTSTPLPLSVAPTSTPLPDENHLGQCAEADGDLFDCFEKFKCEDGLLVIKVDLYSGNGTVYDFYCIPDESVPQLDLPIAIPEDDGATEDNWTGGCEGGPGLDACLDIYSGLCSEEGGDFSVWYDDDGGAGVYCENQSEASQPAPTEAPAIAAAPQDTPAPQPDPKPSTPWGPLGIAAIIVILIGLLVPAVQKVREAAARTQSPMPQTKEHVLLNKDESEPAAAVKIGKLLGVNYNKMDGSMGTDSTSSNTGEGGDSGGTSKPKPAPKPTPPSQPRPTIGDFSGDGDVDPSDFNH